MKKIYINDDKLKMLVEGLYEDFSLLEESNCPDSVTYFGKSLSSKDDDACTFIVIKNGGEFVTEISENYGSSHYILVANLAAKMIGFESLSDFNKYVNKEALPQEYEDSFINFIEFF